MQLYKVFIFLLFFFPGFKYQKKKNMKKIPKKFSHVSGPVFVEEDGVHRKVFCSLRSGLFPALNP